MGQMDKIGHNEPFSQTKLDNLKKKWTKWTIQTKVDKMDMGQMDKMGQQGQHETNGQNAHYGIITSIFKQK